MTMPNLAMLFGPSLMRTGDENQDLIGIGVQSQVAAFLITHALELFGDPAYSGPGDLTPLPSPNVQ